MRELSLHILDLVQNSVTAGASLVEIEIAEDRLDDTLRISISDNGSGMSEAFLKRVRDPFTTTRTTRPVGMGISLFESAAKASNGHLSIQSEEGKGTTLTAVFQHSHIDRAPIGDMAQTYAGLLMAYPQVDFVYVHRLGQTEFRVDTRELKKVLGPVPVSSPDVVQWVKEYIKEGTDRF